MMPRLIAEEQLADIGVGRAAQGAGDAKGVQSIEKYMNALDRQRQGLPAEDLRPARRKIAQVPGLEMRSSGRTFNPLGKTNG